MAYLDLDFELNKVNFYEYIWLANQCSFVPQRTYFFGRTKVKGSCKKNIFLRQQKSIVGTARRVCDRSNKAEGTLEHFWKIALHKFDHFKI